MSDSQNDHHSINFIDEDSYKELQTSFPPEALATVDSVINPETGEFNWDCPCLGGMANPPCGSFFKDAFTCFTYSTAEPKGIDCVDKFREMQECFRQFPEIYADELKGDKDLSEESISNNSAEGPEEDSEIPQESISLEITQELASSVASQESDPSNSSQENVSPAFKEQKSL